MASHVSSSSSGGHATSNAHGHHPHSLAANGSHPSGTASVTAGTSRTTLSGPYVPGTSRQSSTSRRSPSIRTSSDVSTNPRPSFSITHHVPQGQGHAHPSSTHSGSSSPSLLQDPLMSSPSIGSGTGATHPQSSAQGRPSFTSLLAPSLGLENPASPTSSSSVAMALGVERVDGVVDYAAHPSAPNSPWSVVSRGVLQLFNGGRVKIAVEDLSNLTASHVQSCRARSPNSYPSLLSSDLQDVISSGMLTLKAKVDAAAKSEPSGSSLVGVGGGGRRLLARLAEIWSFFIDIMPFVQGAFLPLSVLESSRTDHLRSPSSVPHGSGGESDDVSSEADRTATSVRQLLVTGFLLHVALPIYPTLTAILSDPGLSPPPTSDQLGRLQQMALVLATEAKASVYFTFSHSTVQGMSTEPSSSASSTVLNSPVLSSRNANPRRGNSDDEHRRAMEVLANQVQALRWAPETSSSAGNKGKRSWAPPGMRLPISTGSLPISQSNGVPRVSGSRTSSSVFKSPISYAGGSFIRSDRVSYNGDSDSRFGTSSMTPRRTDSILDRSRAQPSIISHQGSTESGVAGESQQESRHSQSRTPMVPTGLGKVADISLSSDSEMDEYGAPKDTDGDRLRQVDSAFEGDGELTIKGKNRQHQA